MGRICKITLLFLSFYISIPNFIVAEQRKPNILFIAMDDLNDWIGVMGGHPQSKTPNLDRLAKRSVFFNNAHCPSASCNPSRTALFTGMAPYRSGLYSNRQNMRKLMPNAEIIPKFLSRHGYSSMGSGKMLHYFIDAPSWDLYYPDKNTENPFPPTYYPKKRPVHLPHEKKWMYKETDWAELDLDDQTFGGDYFVAQWISQQLQKKQDKPFFLACGFYRPHEPWFVPKKYYEPFPLESIQYPKGYKADDLDDLSPKAKAIGRNRYFAHIQKHKQWKPMVRAYLASIHFADAMLGKVLDALDKSPHKDNTIVVLWSDHGWHLGEKEHWQKFTGWRVCTRVPLFIHVPKGVAGFESGSVDGKISNRAVNLQDIFPTLLELTGLQKEKKVDGNSLVPLLKNPNLPWAHPSITFFLNNGNYAISHEEWRYIHYRDNSEELYHIGKDPHEWNNLAKDSNYVETLNRLRDMRPKQIAEHLR